jgi:penicillin amidase
VFLLALVASASTYGAMTETVTVRGLHAPAEILIDEWGVPHIYAGTHYDAFFVQGFNAARDRLWQIDLWRRRGLGRLAEVLGPDYAEADRAARLFLYRGDMYREWLAYGSDAKEVATAFVAGINAYLDRVASDPALLPPEFRILGYQPAPWSPEDVVRIRSNGLWRNVQNEVIRARIACKGGLAVDALRKRLEPPWQTVVPDGLDPCEIPEHVLDDYTRATQPAQFGAGERVSFSASPPSDLVSSIETVSLETIGSNNWAVAPSRTANGRAILANDPHRAHAVPSLRYVAHLVAPDLDVIGAGEPSLPGISIGHNDRIAFGLTIFALDQEDLYVYTLDPRDDRRYRYRDASEPFLVVQDEIVVAGAAPRHVELVFTRHGPVVHVDREHKRAYAVRAAWLEPGMAPYFGSIEYIRARNWREFVGALNRWGAPAENQVYADVDGNIGYKPAGLFPKRTAFDGLMPVPGDGRYEWDGFFGMDALPVELNPARGFVATANANSLPATYPIDERRVGFEWAAPWRARRIDDVLRAQPRHTLEDSLALQRDYTSALARDLIAHLPASGVPEEIAPTLERLRAWDGVLRPDSSDAALFEVWWDKHLLPAITRVLAGDDVGLVRTVDSLVAIDAIANGSAEVQQAVYRSLADALEDTRRRLGPDSTQWRWGTLHRIRFEHPLLERAPAALKRDMQLADYPRGGSGDTPNATTFNDRFDVVAGASWRFVADVGAWDNARMTNAPGQSGDPRSPFYGNLLETWATDGSVPLLFSRAAIEAHTHSVIKLLPAVDQ